MCVCVSLCVCVGVCVCVCVYVCVCVCVSCALSCIRAATLLLDLSGALIALQLLLVSYFVKSWQTMPPSKAWPSGSAKLVPNDM